MENGRCCFQALQTLKTQMQRLPHTKFACSSAKSSAIPSNYQTARAQRWKRRGTMTFSRAQTDLRVFKKPEGLNSSVCRKPVFAVQFSNFFNAYSKAINSAYCRTGSLFQHPFGRVPITTDRQFWNVIAYIHQNPQRHKFVELFRDWKYSSYGIMISDKPTKLQREIVLGWFGGREQYLDMHARWVTEAKSQWFAEDDYD